MENTLVEHYCAVFSDLPVEESREYEKLIAKEAALCTSTARKKALADIAGSNYPCAFEAFYCLCTVYRRNRDYEKLRKLIMSHQQFADRPSFNHIVIQYQVHSESMYDFDELLESAYDDAIKFSENAGYLQAFCNAFATIMENCNEEDFKSIFKRWYKDALRLINKAIRLDANYAKFYWTKARILSFNGEFSEANRLIAQAISLEDSSRPDYFLTILNYQQTKNSIALRQQRDAFNQRLSRLEATIDQLSAIVCSFNSNDYTANEDVIECPEIYDGDQPYVFVSYAHKDRKLVYSIISALQSSGIRIWYDKGIRGGDEWPEEIGTHISNSSLVVVMLSANSINSKYVRREINHADTESIKIIPVVLDDSRLPQGVQLQLGLNQFLYKSKIAQSRFISTLFDTITINIGDII